MNYLIDHCEPFLGEEGNIWMKLEHCGRYLFARDQIKARGLETVLDIACAEGYGLELLEEYGLKTFGADINRNYLKTAEARSTAVLRELDVDNDEWPYAFRDLDAVVCFETIEHVHDPERLMRNLSGSLKAGGLLLLSVPSEEYEKTDENGINFDPFHLNIFTREEILRMLDTNGFELEGIYGQALCNNMYIAEKAAIERGALSDETESQMSTADSLFKYERDYLITLSQLMGYPDQHRIEESYSHIFIATKK